MYSSEPNTYLNFTVSAAGTKSNSNIAVWKVPETLKFCPIKGGTELANVNKSGSAPPNGTPPPKLPGTMLATSPVDITIPLSKPILEFTPLKKPSWIGSLPEVVKVILLAVTPAPSKMLFTKLCAAFGVE